MKQMTDEATMALYSELKDKLNLKGLEWMAREVKMHGIKSSALQSYARDCEDAADNGDNKIELRTQYTKSGNPEEIWFGDDWFVEE